MESRRVPVSNDRLKKLSALCPVTRVTSEKRPFREKFQFLEKKKEESRAPGLSRSSFSIWITFAQRGHFALLRDGRRSSISGRRPFASVADLHAGSASCRRARTHSRGECCGRPNDADHLPISSDVAGRPIGLVVPSMTVTSLPRLFRSALACAAPEPAETAPDREVCPSGHPAPVWQRGVFIAHPQGKRFRQESYCASHSLQGFLGREAQSGASVLVGFRGASRGPSGNFAGSLPRERRHKDGPC